MLKYFPQIWHSLLGRRAAAGTLTSMQYYLCVLFMLLDFYA